MTVYWWETPLGKAAIDSLPERKQSQFEDVLSRLIAARYGMVGDVTPENCMQSPTVHAIVTAISRRMAVSPVHVYRKTTKNGRDAKERMPNHPVAKLLQYPNKWQSRSDYWLDASSAFIRHGRFFAWKSRGSTGPIRELLPISPREMQLEQDHDTWQLRFKRGGKELDASKLHYVRGPARNFFDGDSPVKDVATAIGLEIAAEKFGATFFENGALPLLVFSFIAGSKGFKTAEDEKKFIDDYQNALGGSNRFKALLMPAGIDKPHPVPIENDKAQFLECAIPGTQVTMADGSLRAVETLRAGDEVLSWNDGFTVARVAAVGDAPIKPCVRIRTARGRQLEVTADHPCLAKAGLRGPGGNPDVREPGWIHAGMLRPGMYVRVGVTEAGIKHGNDVRGAWLLGALVGDGYVRKAGCSFSGADDGVIARMRDELAMFGASLQHRSAYDYDILTGGNCRAGSQFRFLVRKHGIECGAGKKRVPTAVMSGSIEAKTDFLAGYLDTDGTVCKRGRLISWSSINHQLLEDCRALLASIGINAGIYKASEACKREVNGQICSAQTVYQLVVCGAASLRRIAGLLRCAHSEKFVRLRALADSELSRYKAHNWEYDRIKSVEAIGNHRAVGVEVEGTHSFVTSGIVTHNTRKYQRTVIAGAFGVPPHLVGDLERATFNNVEQQDTDFTSNVIQPVTQAFEAAMERDLLTDEDVSSGVIIRFNLDSILRADFKSRQEGLQVQRRNGVINANEWRELERMNPISEDDGGEDYIHEANMAVAGEEPEQQQQQPEPDPMEEIEQQIAKLMKAAQEFSA